MQDVNSSTDLISSVLAFCICTSPFVLILGAIGLVLFTRTRQSNPAAPVTMPPPPAPMLNADPDATFVSKARPSGEVQPPAQFTPSELVLLNGEKFAPKTGLITGKEGSTELLHLEQRVAAGKLGQAALAAAILANEQQGNLRLEVRQTKALFGLTSADKLFIEPGNSKPSWPAATLEARLCTLAAQTPADKNEVSNLVYHLLGEDSGIPWDYLMNLVKAGLAQRNLLDVIEEKKLKLFTVHRYTLLASTRTLAEQYPVTSIQELLTHCQNHRTQLWQALTRGCGQAISRRTERDNDFGDSDSGSSFD